MISIILSACMMFECFSLHGFATNSVNNNSGLDELDVVISAAYFLNATESDERMISENISVEKIVPLYNNCLEIVAYYICFNSGGYAVINNNINNPCAVEFGAGRNENIEELLNGENKIIYDNQFAIYAYETQMGYNRTINADLHDYYTELNNPDINLSNIVSQYKSNISNVATPTSTDADYGFLQYSQLPTGVTGYDTIYRASGVDWLVWDNFEDYEEYQDSKPSSPCPMIAITNLAKYFNVCGYSNLLYAGGEKSTFAYLYELHGPGPHITIANYAKSYFSSRGHSLKSVSLANATDVVNSVTYDRPIAMLLLDLAAEQSSAHWVIGVGYRNYGTTRYIQINNGWQEGIQRYYRMAYGDEQAMYLAATRYYI